MILKYEKPVLLPDLTCPRFLLSPILFETFLESKKTQTVNLLLEQRERSTKGGGPVDKIQQ